MNFTLQKSKNINVFCFGNFIKNLLKILFFICTFNVTDYLITILKKIFPLLLLYAFLFQFSVKTSLIVNYLTNIADLSNVCINKNKPELQCFGKCVLAKWLKDVEKHETENLTLKPFFENQILFFYPFSFSLFNNYTFISYALTQQKITKHGYITKTDHPPSLQANYIFTKL